MCVFRVGQKVAYKGGLEGEHRVGRFFVLGGKSLSVGTVFTIRGIWEHSGVTGLFLAEVENPLMETYLGVVEVPYPAHLFRLVVERKTDIAIFRAMFNTTPETVGA